MADKAIVNFTPLGDFLHHFESAGVCFESGYVSAPVAGATDLDMVGYPVKGDPEAGYVMALEADSAAGITGWILEQGRANLAGSEQMERKVLILARGPAVVVAETLPVNDAAGTPFTNANLLAALEASGIQVRNEPTETSVQTT